MPSVETKYFGALPYTDESLFDFPQGLPAFEDQKGFVLIESAGESAAGVPAKRGARQPLFCCASRPGGGQKPPIGDCAGGSGRPGVGYRRQPVLGGDVMVLALVSLHGEFLATANLMAPIVLNVKTRRGLQAIRRDTRYSHEHPLSGQAAHQSSGAKTC